MNKDLQLLADAEQNLRDLVERKKNIDKAIASLENTIYSLESTYLEETHHLGNILKGFDGYLNSNRMDTRKRGRVLDQDRIFSNSSISFQKSLEKQAEEAEDMYRTPSRNLALKKTRRR